jgi:hypothetical protein
VVAENTSATLLQEVEKQREFKKVCFSFRQFEALYLANKFEELGEGCISPWNCESCSMMLEICVQRHARKR